MDKLLTGYEELVKAHNDSLEYGIFVLKQSGDNIKLLNDKVKCY